MADKLFSAADAERRHHVQHSKPFRREHDLPVRHIRTLFAGANQLDRVRGCWESHEIAKAKLDLNSFHRHIS
jgi:hypothetical protein